MLPKGLRSKLPTLSKPHYGMSNTTCLKYECCVFPRLANRTSEGFGHAAWSMAAYDDMQQGVGERAEL